jgi:2-methylcitrate dehydratase PrpD
VTTTDEILALTAPPNAEVIDRAARVTEADFAAFSEAAARGAGSAVVRALLAVRPTAGPWAPPPAAPAGDPAWDAWLTAAAATVAAGDATWTPENKGTAWPVHPAWCAVFAVGTALADPPAGIPAGLSVPAAVAAGISAATVVESGIPDWGGWSSGTVGAAIGAGVTAGLLLGLTQLQLRSALGICATQAAGLAAAQATPAFALQVGKAAFNGVEAALLARSGLTAPDDPLDGRRGLFALFSSQQADSNSRRHSDLPRTWQATGQGAPAPNPARPGIPVIPPRRRHGIGAPSNKMLKIVDV